MICIYHSRDLDGWMSAAIVKLTYPDVELIGWDYGQTVPELDDAESTIMLDISFPPDIMFEIDMRGSLIWIDHHISAIKSMEEYYKNTGCSMDTEGLRDSKFAACELTWEYFFADQNMPEIVRLLGRYDCFGHKGTDEEQKVLEFQYGARTFIDGVENALAVLTTEIAYTRDMGLKHNPTEEILNYGKSIYKYLCTEAKQTYQRRFDIALDGYRFASVNECRFNPINFGIDYHKDGYDGFACFHYQGGYFNYSLYNDNGRVDCSVICKNRGGGGHKGAAGFRTKEMILQ